MVEYTYDEALELLENNLKNANTTGESLDEDLDFIKDQITTTEVCVQSDQQGKGWVDVMGTMLQHSTHACVLVIGVRQSGSTHH